jgi:D-aminopeptidase
MSAKQTLLDSVIPSLPDLFKGPGGAVAVIRDGEAVVRHSWGYADAERRERMAPSTLMPICSISKEFTCAVLLESVGDPSLLDADLAAYLPQFEGQLPSVADLCNNQSGLRDYWALTVLCGAHPEGNFRPEDGQKLLGRTRTTHFVPGSHYSYSNGNFRILSDLIENRTGEKLGDLIARYLFKPAGMETAQFFPDTGAFQGAATGYEGNTNVGFQPAVNNLYWSGDAGIWACLDDMIAWEAFIDATRDQHTGLYARISAPQAFSDGTPASYGFGLAHVTIGGVAMTGHGGALRGWRMQRLYAPSERLSVVVMFNHEADAHAAGEKVMLAALGQEERITAGLPGEATWAGHYLDQKTKLTLSLTPLDTGRLTARFATIPEVVTLMEDGTARSEDMVLKREGGGILMKRAGENLALRLQRLAGEARDDIEGRFHSDELDADLLVTSSGGAMFIAFEGFLGKSGMQSLYAIGPDVWLLPCPRGLDAPGPGDWTLVFDRDAEGKVVGLMIGCWLARGVRYVKR